MTTARDRYADTSRTFSWYDLHSRVSRYFYLAGRVGWELKRQAIKVGANYSSNGGARSAGALFVSFARKWRLDSRQSDKFPAEITFGRVDGDEGVHGKGGQGGGRVSETHYETAVRVRLRLDEKKRVDRKIRGIRLRHSINYSCICKMYHPRFVRGGGGTDSRTLLFLQRSVAAPKYVKRIYLVQRNDDWHLTFNAETNIRN